MENERTQNQSGRTGECNGDVVTNVEEWQWSLSDEQWEKLQAYLSQTEEGKQRYQVYRNNRDSRQVTSGNAEQWENQWNEDLQHAGIEKYMPVK